MLSKSLAFIEAQCRLSREASPALRDFREQLSKYASWTVERKSCKHPTGLTDGLTAVDIMFNKMIECPMDLSTANEDE
jgi:hypothetical protein